MYFSCWIFFISTLGLVPFSIYKKISRRKKNRVFRQELFLFLSWFCLFAATFFWVLVMDWFDPSEYEHSITPEHINSDGIFPALIFTFANYVIGIFCAYICSSWEIEILEDKFIYTNYAFRKTTILFSEIDTTQSKLLFYRYKSRFKRWCYWSSNSEQLLLVLKNGKKYKFNLDCALTSGYIGTLGMTISKLKIEQENVLE